MNWLDAFRRGLAPQLSAEHLAALQGGLECDDPALVQGATVQPPPLQAYADVPVEAACLVGYCGWRGDGLRTVAEVEEFFARATSAMDDVLGERAGCRHLLNWYDEVPREVMRPALLAEVKAELARRAAAG
jgi:hypothetical protein